MKLIKFAALALILGLWLPLQAQEKMLTLEDCCWLNPAVYPPSMRNLGWLENTHKFVYIKDNALVQEQVKNNKTTTLLTLEQLNSLLKELQQEETKHFPTVRSIRPNTLAFKLKNVWYSYQIKENSLHIENSYPAEAENAEMEREHFKVAYTKGNNLFLAIDGKEIAVTSDTKPGIVNGQTVHRSEFGISDGIFWSPKGQLLAYYHKDESMVTDYPLVDIDTRVATLKNTKYPMAGMTSEVVKVAVYNPATKKTIYLQTGEPAEQYLTNLSWSPDEKHIYIAVLNRDQNHMKLNQYDAENGAFIKTLFEETDTEWVEPEHGLYFLNGRSDQFVWMSERDGWNHLYLYSIDGKLIKQLTQGEWVVTQFLGFDTKNLQAFYQSTAQSPLENGIYSVSLKSGKTNTISTTHGTHSALLSSDGKYLIDTYSSTEIARQYELKNKQGKTLRVIQENQDPLKEYALGEMKMGQLKAKDGSDLYYRIILPPGFDPEKKYPVFHYVYGGPHLQMVTDSWLGGAGLFMNFMAQQGYIVFNMDNHGTPHRGLDFEQKIFRNLGVTEVEDQMIGINYLKTLPYVDANRIGVDGWSYGGFMTISLMLKHPETYKVGCAGGPVIDWSQYEVMYGERYMDTPQANPEGYQNAHLINYIDQLQGKLMVMHGTLDPTVVWQQSLSFLKHCMKQGKQIDYFVYPGHEHNVRGKDRVYMYQKILNYFNAALK